MISWKRTEHKDEHGRSCSVYTCSSIKGSIVELKGVGEYKWLSSVGEPIREVRILPSLALAKSFLEGRHGTSS